MVDVVFTVALVGALARDSLCVRLGFASVAFALRDVIRRGLPFSDLARFVSSTHHDSPCMPVMSGTRRVARPASRPCQFGAFALNGCQAAHRTRIQRATAWPA
jgi:hypothetical protein